MSNQVLNFVHPDEGSVTEIPIPSSKSFSNRNLILEFLSDGKLIASNTSNCADTVGLVNLLNATHSASIFDAGIAGTTYRFMLAYLALVTRKPILLTGHQRMQERPIGDVVDALNNNGAKILYKGSEGFPPLEIHPSKWTSNEFTIKANKSSQFVSALLLTLPFAGFPEGGIITLEGEVTSPSYIHMTLDCLKAAGISSKWEGNKIHVSSYKPSEDITLEAESDWSSAQYWYLVCMFSGATLNLKGLRLDSKQGDRFVADVFQKYFGVVSKPIEGGVQLSRKEDHQLKYDNQILEFDMLNCPDLTQAIMVAILGSGNIARFTNIENLRLKETDRIDSMKTELEKFNAVLAREKEDCYILDASEAIIQYDQLIYTYNDHRMALAFAPLAIVCKNLKISQSEVIVKSYPEFWDHLALAGFTFQA